MTTCHICTARRATQADYDAPEPDDDLCWRKWNAHAACFDTEERLRDAASGFRDALVTIASTNWIDAALDPQRLREIAMDALVKAGVPFLVPSRDSASTDGD